MRIKRLGRPLTFGSLVCHGQDGRVADGDHVLSDDVLVGEGVVEDGVREP